MSNQSNSWFFFALFTASLPILASLFVESASDESSDCDLESCSADDVVEQVDSAEPASNYKLPGGGDTRQKYWAN